MCTYHCIMSPKMRPLIMGILNATPDSFYDGGRYDRVEAAVRRARQMIDEGADIVDIGGESTGPVSAEVDEAEELKRVIPIIEKMRNVKYERNNDISDSACRTPHAGLRISADTTKASVARATLAAGATIVNDVSAGRHDPAMFPLVAERGCSIVLMYSKDPSPRTTIQARKYDDAIATIRDFLSVRIAAAQSAGIDSSQIIVDPGLGHFVSSDPKYSWEILERLAELQSLGCPILVSPSRKSFTADHPGDSPEKRLPGTLRAVKLAVQNGASVIRTHDVEETIRVIM